jgi:hypothetical protein
VQASARGSGDGETPEHTDSARDTIMVIFDADTLNAWIIAFLALAALTLALSATGVVMLVRADRADRRAVVAGSTRLPVLAHAFHAPGAHAGERAA